MIWIALIWPVFFGLISLIFFNRRVTPKEAGTLLLIPLVGVLAADRYGKRLVTKDVEYWGGAVKSAVYSEPWNQKTKCRHKSECIHMDEKGKPKHSDDGPSHEFDIEEHKASYFAYDTNGEKIPIDAKRFAELCSLFKNRKFKDMHRRFHTKDGDRYVTTWGGQMDRLEPTTTAHQYENKILGSRSTYHYNEVDPTKWGLFDYPEIKEFYRAPAILGMKDEDASRRLDILNAQLGPQLELRAMILVFVGKPRDAAFDQEAYWMGGNKNEFVICIGTDDDRRVQWAHVFSWTKVEALKIEARNEVMNQVDKPLDLSKVVTWMARNMQRFERKSFSEFDYLHVDPPLWVVLATHAATIVFTALWLWLAVVIPNRKSSRK